MGSSTPAPQSTWLPIQPQEQAVADLARKLFREDNPSYYHFEGDYGTNCSNFVSQIWWEAGIRLPGSTWSGDNFGKNYPPMEAENYPWFRTPDQQMLFSSYHGEFRIMYS
jgi:hypothetical protein